MTKPQILEVVKEMHTAWVSAYNVAYNDNCFSTHTDDGFCKYLIQKSENSLNYESFRGVRGELLNDRDKYFPSTNVVFGYWYPVLYDRDVNPSKIKKTLKPRIDHLRRTITRLENEIKNEN